MKRVNKLIYLIKGDRRFSFTVMINTAYFLGTAGFSTNLHPNKEVRNKKPEKFKNRLNGDSFTVNKQCFGEFKASQVFIVFRSCFQCFYISNGEKRSFEIAVSK